MTAELPADWEMARVGEIATVVGGGTPKSDIPEYWGGDVAWLTPKDLRDHTGRFVSHGERNITRQGLDNSSARLHPPGTVLVSSRAPIGYVAIAAGELATSQGFRSLVLHDRVIPEFAYWVMATKTPEMTAVAGGSTFKEISGKALKTLDFPVPPANEQRAIAFLLGSLDDRIQWCIATAGLAREILRALAAATKSRGQAVPVSDLCMLQRDIVASDDLDGQVWSLHSIPAFDDQERPVRESGDNIKSAKFRVPPGAVLLSKLNPDINRVWLTDLEFSTPPVCSTELLPLVSKAAVPDGFVFGALTTHDFANQMAEVVSGGTKSHQRVKPDDVLRATVGSPSSLTEKESQLAGFLAELLRTMRKQMQSLEQIRDELVPKLVTGQLRVRDVDRFLEWVGHE